MAAEYVYPTDETATDPTELQVDPWKLLRERALIESLLAYGWRTGLDFGTGSGRYLPTLDALAQAERSGRANDKTLFAYDLDLARVRQARLTALKTPVSFIDGDLGRLDAALPDSHLDAVLCCQVLGHVAEATRRDILDFMHRKLRQGGAIVICAPFCANSHREDYYHLVDLRRARNGEPDFRTPIAEADFSSAARSSREGYLPVRAYAVGDVEVSGDVALPRVCAAPQAFTRDDRFVLAACLIYSVHVWDGVGRPAIGDIVMKWVKG